MDTEIKSFRLIFGGILSILSIQLKLLVPLTFGYTLLIFVDMFMGIRATTYEIKQNPDIPYKVGSTSLVRGFMRKLERVAIIFTAIVVDYLMAYMFVQMNVSFEIFGMDIAQHPIVAILVTVSFVGSELVSIIENYCRMGNEPPIILGDLGKAIMNSAKEKGERYIESIIDLTKEKGESKTDEK